MASKKKPVSKKVVTKKKTNKKEIYTKDIPLLVAVAVELLVLFIAYVILTSV